MRFTVTLDCELSGKQQQAQAIVVLVFGDALDAGDFARRGGFSGWAAKPTGSEREREAETGVECGKGNQAGLTIHVAKHASRLGGFKPNVAEFACGVAVVGAGWQAVRMASVVFFRAVNVGGHQTFKPGLLAKELSAFGVVNIGAAGTFVVRENVSPKKLHAEILRRLPFQPGLMICAARQVLTLARGNWFPATAKETDLGRFVSVLQKVPRTKPSLPIEVPAGPKWEVRLVAVSGPFVMSIRRLGETYSNAVVEKHFGQPATTRNWNTIEKICAVLEKQSAA